MGVNTVQKNAWQKISSNYLFKFGLIFALLYYGNLAMIGLMDEKNWYVPVLDHYFNYPAYIRYFILKGSKISVELLGYSAELTGPKQIKINHWNGVNLNISCLGIGVLIFWFSFVLADNNPIKMKLKWLFLGIVLIMLTNIFRISALLISNYNRWENLIVKDHHLFFNITAYVIIFCLIFFYSRKVDLVQNRKNDFQLG